MNNQISIIEANLRDLLRRKTENTEDENIKDAYQEHLDIAKKNEQATFEKFKGK